MIQSDSFQTAEKTDGVAEPSTRPKYKKKKWHTPAYGMWAQFYPGTPISEIKDTVIKGGAPLLTKEFNRLEHETKDDSGRLPVYDHNDAYLARIKDRYIDIQCIDASRVKLDSDLASQGSVRDYIHANYVDGFEHLRAYISTQGPLEKTINDFWRMVWQEDSLVIVMVTKLCEKNRIKCDCYWPMVPGEIYDTGSFIVRNEGICNKIDYDITKLQLEHKETKATRTIKHFIYLQWPDTDVPINGRSILKFIFKVRISQRQAMEERDWKGHPRGPPIIVHCSAGVGRTGTIEVLDMLIYRLDATGKVNIFGEVQKMRRQRKHSVQTARQYIFIYACILQYAAIAGWIDDNFDYNGYLLSGVAIPKTLTQLKS